MAILARLHPRRAPRRQKQVLLSGFHPENNGVPGAVKFAARALAKVFANLSSVSSAILSMDSKREGPAATGKGNGEISAQPSRQLARLQQFGLRMDFGKGISSVVCSDETKEIGRELSRGPAIRPGKIGGFQDPRRIGDDP